MVSIDNRFWTIADESLVKQRMKASDWAQILLASRDQVIIRGRCRELVAKKMGYGIVEVTLKPLENIVGDKL